MNNTQGIIPIDQLKYFVTAGNSIITVKSTVSDEHLTFKIYVSDNDEKKYFVKVLTSPEYYTYLGMLYATDNQLVYKHGDTSRISTEAKSHKVFQWLIAKIDHPEILKQALFYHEGYCCVCGRTLTTPESIEKGIGPVCEAAYVGRILMLYGNVGQKTEEKKIEFDF